MVSNRTPYHTHFIRLYSTCILIHTGKGERVEPERREKRRATGESTDYKAELKIPT
jgi:hypothetical protein